MDIVVTLPASIKWSDYQKELLLAEDEDSVINFKVSSFPTNCSVGDKCYLCYKGAIRGWMKIVGFSEKPFQCTTTGKQYKGKFIQRSGKFYYIEPIAMKGFQGYRYYNG